MNLIVIGMLGIIVLFICFLVKIPISISMIIVGYFGYGYVTTFLAANRIVASDIFTTFTSYSLSVIPMFVLMGFLAYHAGIGTKVYSFAYKLVGRFPGGLAMATQVACAIFGAICGSSTATTATMGSIAIPEMKRYNYSDKLSTGCVAAGGALGIMIPPSVILVLYGIATEQSIAKLFIAGIVPGILLTFLYIAAIFIVTFHNPALAPAAPGPHPKFKEIVMSLPNSGLIEVIIIFIISLGGLFAGWFTPTEAGGVGAAGVLLVTLLQKSLNWEKIKKSLSDTTRTSAMILFLVTGATIFGRFMAITRIPFELAGWVEVLPLPPVVVVGVILLIYLLLGTFIDSLPLMLLTVPIFYPVAVQTLGYDPIWFGVMMVVAVTMGCITPPVGINVYVVKGITKDIPLQVIFQGIWPFLIALIVCGAILIVFPQIALFLPNYLL
ncbi:MAG: TRAP transporter large permease [Bacillota bacterium]|nr:TRAP transporter large permease [Bacillota bacterium]